MIKHQNYSPNYKKVVPLPHNKKTNQLQTSLQTLYNEPTDNRQYNYSDEKIKMIDKLSKELYQPASYEVAVLYKNNRSYLKKVNNNSFIQLDLFADTNELKQFGLGIYFFIQFIRRLTWLFLIMTIIQLYSIIINWKGKGLSNYSQSFSTYLIQTSIGNYGGNAYNEFDYIIAVVSSASISQPSSFSISSGKEQQQENILVQPQNFCLSIEGLDDNMINQGQLANFFSNFGPVYEVSIVKRHKNKLSYFQQLDQLQQTIQEEELQILLGSGDKKRVKQLKTQKQKLQQTIHKLKITPRTVSAYVHFQFEQTKRKCVSFYQDHCLQATCSHCCLRNMCCCCIKEPQAKFLFNNKKLLLKDEIVPNPQDINWQGFQVNMCSKICRRIVSFIIILVFLIISCTIIGLCSLYIVSYSSNCDSINVDSYTTATALATNSQSIMRCYCNAHFISSFSNSQIKTACDPYLTNIYIQQAIQYVVIITSSIINLIFGLIVSKLTQFMRPESKSTALVTKTFIFTIFIIINSILIPILIYGDIYGFKASSYVSLLTIVSSDLKNIFLIDNLNFYPNFNNIWYRNVSPIFTNFLIINMVVVWISYFINKCWNDTSGLKVHQGKILQKHLNQKITSYQVQIYKQAAYIYLTLIMICLFYTGIPILIPIGFLNILSRYITIRSLLQNYSVRIQGLTQHFLQFSITIFTIILLVCPLIGEWMLVANKLIFPTLLPYGNPFALERYMGLFKQLDMQLYLPFYIGISVIVLIEWIISSTLISFCYCLCKSCCCTEKQPIYHTRPFNEYAKSLNMLCSYNIRNNDNMRNAILNLQKYLVNKGKI